MVQIGPHSQIRQPTVDSRLATVGHRPGQLKPAPSLLAPFSQPPSSRHRITGSGRRPVQLGSAKGYFFVEVRKGFAPLQVFCSGNLGADCCLIVLLSSPTLQANPQYLHWLCLSWWLSTLLEGAQRAPDVSTSKSCRGPRWDSMFI